jgi:hypothetical protein
MSRSATSWRMRSLPIAPGKFAGKGSLPASSYNSQSGPLDQRRDRRRSRDCRRPIKRPRDRAPSRSLWSRGRTQPTG